VHFELFVKSLNAKYEDSKELFNELTGIIKNSEIPLQDKEIIVSRLKIVRYSSKSNTTKKKENN